VILPFRKPKSHRRRLPWGTVLLIALAFSGFQYATKGQVTWLTTAFQQAEHTGRGLLNDPPEALADIDLELPDWLSSDGPSPAPVAEIGRAGKDAETAFSAPAWDLSGRTVRVIDGDTIEVLDATKQTHRIRLHGIDTPERGQPFGRAAGRALADIIAGEGVGIDVKDTDRYGRTVGVVHLGAQNVNVTMVRKGYAWWYKKYAPFDDALREAQQRAQAEGLGLWQEKNPIPPWEWRRGRRE
jgi:endonuclease YncB( thermonuclease family)